jgi:hypothetical protein
MRVTAGPGSPFPNWMNDEIEIDDWPVPSAEVRLELDRQAPAWPDADDDR